jgi:hypothetical protein
MPQEDTTEEENELTEDGKPITRLVDLLTREVSLVSRGANKRKILVRKGDDMPTREVIENEDGTFSTVDNDREETEKANDSDDTSTEDVSKQALPKGVKEAAVSMVEDCLSKTEDLIKDVKALDEVEEDGNSLPGDIVSDVTNKASILRGINSKYPSPKAKSDDESDNTSDDTETVDTEKSDDTVEVEKRFARDEKSEAARGILWAALEEVDSGAFAPEDEKKTVEDIMSLLASVVKTKKEEVEKAAKQISSGTKTQVVSALEKAASELKKLLADLKAADETEDAGSAPMPSEFAKRIEEIAGMFDSIANEYPAKSEKADGGQSPLKVLSEAHKLLGVLLAKLKPGQTLDEDSFQQLDKLRSVISSVSGGKSDVDTTEETEKIDTEPAESTDESVEKAGAKMARARRKRFKEAITTLLALFKEVMPDADLGTWPNATKKEDDTSSEEVETLKAELKKSQDNLVSARERIESLESSPVPTNTAEIETSNVQVHKSDTTKVDWSGDLNEQSTA